MLHFVWTMFYNSMDWKMQPFCSLADPWLVGPLLIRTYLCKCSQSRCSSTCLWLLLLQLLSTPLELTVCTGPGNDLIHWLHASRAWPSKMFDNATFKGAAWPVWEQIAASTKPSLRCQNLMSSKCDWFVQSRSKFYLKTVILLSLYQTDTWDHMSDISTKTATGLVSVLASCVEGMGCKQDTHSYLVAKSIWRFNWLCLHSFSEPCTFQPDLCQCHFT